MPALVDPSCTCSPSYASRSSRTASAYGEHIRSWMTGRFREVLDETGVPWVEVRGPRHARESAAAKTLIDRLGEAWA